MSLWGNNLDTFESVHFYNLKYVVVNGSQSAFHNLESESNLQIRAVTRSTNRGGQRIVAYRMDLTLYLPNNKYSDYQADILKLQDTPVTSLSVVWRAARGQSPGQNPVIDASLSGDPTNAPSTVMNLSCDGWSLETIESRPRMIIKFNAIYSVRLFEAAIMPYFITYP